MLSPLRLIGSCLLLGCLLSWAGSQVAAGELFGSDCGNNRTHNFYYGTKAYYDRLLYMNHTLVEYKFLRKVSLDVEIPAKGQPVIGLITYIEVLDQFNDGNGGCAFIRNGGVGTSRVTLHLKSQRNYGIDFVIKVYGH